jgi:hypothetical protein
MLFVIADAGFRLRDRASALQAYTQPRGSERDRARAESVSRASSNKRMPLATLG